MNQNETKMDRVIWKYKLKIEPVFKIRAPAGAIMRMVAVQEGVPYVWLDVHPNRSNSVYTMRCVSTGEIFDEYGWNHIGSVVLPSDEVYHFFTIV